MSTARRCSRRSTFRRAYDAIVESKPGTRGDMEYLRILHLAATTMEADVEAALQLLFDTGGIINADAVKTLVRLRARRRSATLVPPMEPLVVDLSVYDRLIDEVAA
jgi:hypothetical protein